MIDANKLPFVVIRTIMDSLDHLRAKGTPGLLALYDLQQASREPSYRMARESAVLLARLQLVLRWQPQPKETATVTLHDAVSAIALAAIRVDREIGGVRLRALGDVVREIGA